MHHELALFNTYKKDLTVFEIKAKSISDIFRLNKNIKKEDILFISDAGLSIILYFVKNSAVVFCWDVCPMFLKYFRPISRFWFILNASVMLRAKRIIVPSESTKRDIVNYLGYPAEQIDVIFPGIDHIIFKRYNKKKIKYLREKINKCYGIGDNERILLYVGGEQPRKNLRTLLFAFEEAAKQIPLRLLIAGPRDWRGEHEKLEKILIERKIRDKIFFVGMIENKKLPDLYNAVDLFVFPSYYEGFGLPLIEAMACGCPIITTDTSSIPEVVGDTAIKIKDPFDHKEMADKIIETLSDREKMALISAKEVVRARNFSWKKTVMQITRSIMLAGDIHGK